MENGHLQFSPYPGKSLQLGDEKVPFLLLCCRPAASVPAVLNAERVIWGRYPQHSQAEPGLDLQ